MASNIHSAKTIGTEFVRHFYTILYENPKEISRLFGSESVFLYSDDKDGSGNDAVVGQENIAKKIESLELRNCFSKIKRVDCQSTVNDSILIQVSGRFSHTDKPWRTFAQSILLELGSQKKYYARNSIFRYQLPNEIDVIIDDIEKEEGEAQREINVEDTSEVATLETVTDQVNEIEDNARNEDQAQNVEKHSIATDDNDDAEEEKLESVTDQNDEADEESDLQQHDSTDGKSESTKKDTSTPTWAALASKSAHVPTGEPARKKMIRKPVENTNKSSRSNHHNKDDSPSQRSNNFRNTSQRDGQQTEHQIFIGGLNADVSEKELRNEFAVFGEVKHVKTNISKGFGFVSFENEESVKKALSADFKIFVGKTHINIEEKKSSNVRHENRRGREAGQRHSGFHNKPNKGGNYRGGERGSGRRQDRN